jgi:hypothetical protein
MLAEIDERAVRQPRKAEIQWALRRVETVLAEREAGEAEDPRATPDPVAPERQQLADAGILHLSPILQQLLELWNGPENDDYGRLRPTRDAFEKTIELLVDAAIDGHFQRRQIPYGCVSTDSEGGVRIEWVREAASVHLAVPATKTEAAYVYHEVGSHYATETATPESLSRWLSAIE